MMHTCRMIRMMKKIIGVSGIITTTRTVKVKGQYCFLIQPRRRTVKLIVSSTQYTVSINMIVELFESGFHVVLHLCEQYV